ncbi:hypothetical protein N646_1251 [Vibrio alginolyticus NBRC 15630 = ATCC 17749]|jgi:hypothetical protein|uniref:Uncharacterized protein n=1 Tax=Vibrio alginolyticus (strain ATCC 17749 / DSM 2171 / NBRC 15630 / NCIMB 1903 / NCTC 12160 / XII-53) TaxID=1219076 RepID=A0A2I3C7V0_VIBAX|nr:hypothetical protein N646_1251 [Vibrio alginolyticus NBRC 15630 = ATCC 17749]CDT91467.1 conserved exported hypothetical protein [Vibrio diabolicus]
MNSTFFAILGALFGSLCALSLFSSLVVGAWWLVDFIVLS